MAASSEGRATRLSKEGRIGPGTLPETRNTRRPETPETTETTEDNRIRHQDELLSEKMTLFSIAGICLLFVSALVHADSNTCEMPNCSDCIDYLPQCQICPTGTTKTDDLKQCIDCPDNCEECIAPTESELECTSCDESYILVEGACVQCAADCSVCADADTCETCQSRHYLVDGACSGCPTRCASCSNGDSCNSCVAGAYMDDGSCRGCSTNVAACTLVGVVITINQCDDDYELNTVENACLACDSECSECSNEVRDGTNAVCTACDDEYFLVTEECTPCADLCKTCDADTCNECVDGYATKDANVATCQACGKANCAECTVSNAGVESCLDCEVGYFWDSTDCVACSGVGNFWDSTNSVCVDCIANCDACTTDVDCTTCADGYGEQTDSNSVITCMALPDQCTALDPVAASDTAVCDAYTCSSGCTTCSDATTCTVCTEVGNFLDTDVCTPCVSGCVTCTADVATCTACTDVGNFLDTDVCTPCNDANCAACSDLVTCTTCHDGYVLDNNACDQACPSNCNACTFDATAFATEATCDVGACASGYYLDDGACLRCSSDCEECTDAATCTKCDAIFGLADAACVACGDFCDECFDDVTVCVDCASRTIVNDAGSCEECPENCDVCMYDGVVKCTSCDIAYAISEDECVECPVDCNFCELLTIDGEDIYSCTDCSSGYGTNNYVCAACPANCEECSQKPEGVICSACEVSFVLVDDVCEACPSRCLECNSRGICNECASGYGLSYDKESCVVCVDLTIENCALCTDHPDYENDTASCLACSSGFYLLDSQGNGTDAECLAISTVDGLACGDGVTVVDEAPMCEVGACELGFSNYDGECAKSCYRCGDPRIGQTVPFAECITQNTTGVMYDYCPDGVCIAIREKMDGVDGMDAVSEVVAGCMPPGFVNDDCDVCDSTDLAETCSKCCGTALCNDFASDESAFDSATSLSAAVGLILPLILLLIQ